MSSTIKDSKIKAGSLSDLSVDAFLLFDEKLNLLNITMPGKDCLACHRKLPWASVLWMSCPISRRVIYTTNTDIS